MKCIQLDMDGITYFVTVTNKGIIRLYVNSLGTTPIFVQDDWRFSPHKFTEKDAKKFVIRALSVTNK